jgi:homoserine/homoserine lactone efflux protein
MIVLGMSLELWLFFVVTEAVLCVTPGPAVLFVVSCGLAHGGRAALWANAGILSGNTFYFALSALGVSALLVASHDVFFVIKLLGAAYLVVLGVQTIRGAGLGLRSDDGATPAARGGRMLVRGFVLQTANAKALLFFVALLPQFIDATWPVAPQILILAVTSVAIEFVVLAVYGYFAGRAARLARERRFVVAANRVSGGLLVAAGAAIALSDR